MFPPFGTILHPEALWASFALPSPPPLPLLVLLGVVFAISDMQHRDLKHPRLKVTQRAGRDHWSIVWYRINPKTGNSQRVRNSFGLNSEKMRKDPDRRMLIAKNLIRDLAGKLIWEGKQLMTTSEILAEKGQLKAKAKVKAAPLVSAALWDTYALHAPTLRATSRPNYSTTCTHWANWQAMDCPELTIAQIEPSHVAKFLNYLISKIGPTSRNNYLTCLKSLFGVMVARGELAKSPAAGIKPLRTSAQRHQVFSTHQRDILWSWLKQNDPGLYLLTRCIYYTFVRPAELMQLRVKDLDLERSSILISGHQSKNHRTQAVRIPPALLPDLQQLTGQPEEYIFSRGLSPGPHRVLRKTASYAHADLLARFGMEKKGYDLYSWKHTGVCMAYKAGVDIKTLQTQLRHSELATTDKYLRGLGMLLDDAIMTKEW